METKSTHKATLEQIICYPVKMSLKKWLKLEKKQIQISSKLSDLINSIQAVQEAFKKLSEVRK